MRSYPKHYINGRWAPSNGPQSIAVVNPTTETIVAQVSCGTAGDIDLAVAAAKQALPHWAERPAADRADYLRTLHQGLVDRADVIALTITEEVGMPIKLAKRIQAGLPAAVMASYAELLESFSFETRIGNSLVLREPVGVVGCITPWNYPLHQAIAKVAAALAAGCTVVLKPSELAPSCIFILAEIVASAGFPDGVFNLVSGNGKVTGEALARHQDVAMLSFTGSTRVGRHIAELAAGGVKRTALELGGKSASVVLDDADLARAVKGTVASCFLNSGQTCTALTRLLVPAGLYPQAARLAVEIAGGYAPGDPGLEQTRLGPLISADQKDRVCSFIEKGLAEGAELLCGGPEPPAGLDVGFFVSPTIFGRVNPEMSIAREEIFGPVLSIISYDTEDDALQIANSTPYGLSGAVWSADQERALIFAKRMRSGQVDINGAPFNILAPFGGVGQSGYGRELGAFGLDEFLEYKSIQLPQK
ncbi:MAG TPA: aldehyde dehydrogenase family protein [Geothermobacteraceae bacterium]|nr:aldehyde dehydrogenase family protein [Geothermobacteraceae bacterium]